MTACSCRTATSPAMTTGASPAPEDFAVDIEGSADAEIPRGLQGGRPAGAPAGPDRQGDRRRVHPGHRPARHAARPGAAPAIPRRPACGAERGGDQAGGRRRHQDRAGRRFRGLGRRRRDCGAASGGGGTGARHLDRRAAAATGAAGGGVAAVSAGRRPALRRPGIAGRKPGPSSARPIRARSWPTRRWRRPVPWPNTATGICRSGRTPRASIRCATAWPEILGLKRDQVTVRHAHGAGCYGHNGADDAALDAAVIALQVPDHCIRVQWRREEEFAFEPVSTAHTTRIRVALDEAGRPLDWTTEVWAGPHVQRPVSGGTMLAHEALPSPPPPPKAERSDRGGRRRRHAQRFPAIRCCRRNG